MRPDEALAESLVLVVERAAAMRGKAEERKKVDRDAAPSVISPVIVGDLIRKAFLQPPLPPSPRLAPFSPNPHSTLKEE